MPEYGVRKQPFQVAQEAPMVQKALYGILNALYGSDAMQDAPLDMMMPLGGMAKSLVTPGVVGAAKKGVKAGKKITEKLSLREDQFRRIMGHDQRSVSIIGAEGKPIGDVTFTIAPDGSAKIGMAKGEIGVSAWKQVIDLARKKYPNIKHIYGDRIGNRLDRPVQQTKELVGPSVGGVPLPMSRKGPVSPTGVTPFELMQLGLSKGAPPWKMGSK